MYTKVGNEVALVDYTGWCGKAAILLADVKVRCNKVPRVPTKCNLTENETKPGESFEVLENSGPLELAGGML